MQPVSFAAQAVPLVLVFFVFYCIVLRPGRLAEGRRWAAVKALSGGEDVLLSCGIVGTFVERRGTPEHGEYVVDVGGGTLLGVLEAGIQSVAPPNSLASARAGTPPAADSLPEGGGEA